MTTGIPIVNYQQTNTRSLLLLTEKLHSKEIFHQYLTPQQLIVLDKILSLENPELKIKVWEKLMNGDIVLNVRKVILQEETHKSYSDLEIIDEKVSGDEGNTQNDSSIMQESKTTDGTQESTKRSADNELLQEDTDFSEVDLEDLQQRMSELEFVGNLSLKVRYVLWEKAIDPMYELIRDEDEEEDQLDYVLFDSEKTVANATNEQITLQEKTSNKISSAQHFRDEDEDYDDEDEEENDSETNDGNKELAQTGENYDENGHFVLDLDISKETLCKLRVSNTQAIMENFNKIYHNFENDRETLLKRLKLEENDKLLETSKKRKYEEEEEEEEEEEQEKDNTDQSEDSSEQQGNKKSKSNSLMPNLSVSLGAANLSLKHLLASIQENKSKLKISDYELKHLVMDVRKNRSKWASDDRIGQEELYDACEKVVLELRNYTEHSTAFLNKVSKREAPNYYQIIKKPMDLNTVLKKLKTFQYKSKQQFVDDIMLIWKNCLTYNSDPKHFLRAHAIAMQKRSLSLIPLIPDIVIRERADVEKELEEMEKENDKDEEEELSGTGRKGGNVRGIHKPTEEGGADTAEQDQKEEEENEVNELGSEKSPIQDETKIGSVTIPTATAESNDEENDEDEDEDDDEDLGDSQMYFIERDDDRDDLELSTWKNLTAKARAEICMKRSDLFKGDKINHDASAILRNPGKMKEFEQFIKEYKEQKEAETQRKKLEQESMMKNGFGAVIKQEDEEQQLPTSQSQQQGQALGTNDVIEKESNDIELDDSMLLLEYNVANSMPDLGYKGVNDNLLDKEEEALVQRILSEGNPKPSVFLANKDTGLTPKINENISLIQEIRHICHKIALIRTLQNSASSFQQQKGNPIGNSNQLINNSRYKCTSINESLDLDPVSQLSTHDYKNNKQLIWRIMHKNVSKIAMSNGFESTQPTAVNMLSEIAGDYLSNLIKTVKVHQESSSINERKPKQILAMSLLENGIAKPDDLYTYVENEYTKKTNKMKDIKSKLNNFLKELLRPTLQDLSERNFEDESQSFLTGDFSSQLTGEDFFGFRELGLEKEFGVLSNSIPLQLLTFQFRGKDTSTEVKDKKIQPEEFDNVVYNKVTKDSIDKGLYWTTLKPLLEKAYERSNGHNSKLAKARSLEPNSLDKPSFIESTTHPIAEDDQIPLKTKTAARPRLPPTGKINTNYKKKTVIDAFFLPDEPAKPVDPKPEPTESQVLTPSTDTNGFENGFGLENTPPSSSFNLSLPRIDE